MNLASKFEAESGFVPLAPRAARSVVPSLERRRLQFYGLQIAADAGSLFLGLLLAGALYVGEFPSGDALAEASVLLPAFLVIAIQRGVYCQRSLGDWRFSVKQAGWALILAAVIVIFIMFYLKSTQSFSRIIFSAGLALTFGFLAVTRVAIVRMGKHWFGPSVLNILLIDDGGPEIHLDHAYHVDVTEQEAFADLSDPRALDRLGRYVRNMDRVIVSCPMEKRRIWTFAMRAAGVNAELVSEPLHEIGAIGIHREDGFTSIIVSAGPLGTRSRALKRLLDLAIAVPALLFLSPLMLAIAAAIWLEDREPVLFRQRRLGRGNRFFDVLKFRSMRTEQADKSGDRSASRHDDRVTRVGRFIRRTSLDELPQLFNVIDGEMSLVGPRPHALGSQAGSKLFWEVDVHYWRRHALKPGLTGLAQIRGLRGATDHEQDLTDRLQADLEYISDWSVWRDLKIIFATFRVLVHDRAF